MSALPTPAPRRCISSPPSTGSRACAACLGLFEGVVTGAADGYARMSEKPAATLLHLGPGMANGLANIHNANKASSPMVNIVGDHATYHRHYDAPLTSDIESAGRPFSRWVKTSPDARSVAADGAAAIAAARTAAGPDRDPDPAGRHRLERGLRPGRGAAADCRPRRCRPRRWPRRRGRCARASRACCW